MDSSGSGSGQERLQHCARAAKAPRTVREYTIPIPIEGYDDKFPWEHSIGGDDRRFLEVVQEETGVTLQLNSYPRVGCELVIAAAAGARDVKIERAVEMSHDLVDHTYQEAAGWAGTVRGDECESDLEESDLEESGRRPALGAGCAQGGRPGNRSAQAESS